MKQATLFLSFVMFFCAQVSMCQKSIDEIVPAPLPRNILTAKMAFVSNGGGNDPSVSNRLGTNPAYDLFYSDMKGWGHYRLVDTTEAAEIILEISYEWRYYGWYVIDRQGEKTDPQRTIRLAIYDAKNHQRLWTIEQHPKFAYHKANREKEFIKACHQLAANFERRVEAESKVEH